MSEFVEKYINPFTDFGFKKLFGGPNKDCDEFVNADEIAKGIFLIVSKNGKVIAIPLDEIHPTNKR